MFERLIWHQDRMILGGLVFRLEHSKNQDWELGENCFAFYKTKELIGQYEAFWATRPGFEARNIFEVGMFDGGSAAFWVEILRPAKFVGIDVLRRTDSDYFKEYVKATGSRARIRTYWGTDQTNAGRLREIVLTEFQGALDLVFDDASHLYEHTKCTFETLFPLLRPRGLYIIEDWAWYHWTGMGSFGGQVPLTRLVFELVEAIGSSTGVIRSLSIFQGLAVIERGEAPLDTSGGFRLEQKIRRLEEKRTEISPRKADPVSHGSCVQRLLARTRKIVSRRETQKRT